MLQRVILCNSLQYGETRADNLFGGYPVKREVCQDRMETDSDRKWLKSLSSVSAAASNSTDNEVRAAVRLIAKDSAKRAAK
jgi:hypothetical protein